MQTVNKTAPDTSSTSSTATQSAEDFKDGNLKYSLSKFEYDLYHEEDDVAEQVIRVKRVSMPNREEKWKVMSDNKLIFTIESPKISKKEREFLQTIDGFNFILGQAKTGIKSLNSFRNELKKKLDQIAAADKAAISKTKISKKKSK